MRLFHISVALWLVFALVLTAGCNSSGVKIGAVTGRITKNGKPQAKISVYLTPVEGGRPSEGLTNENGEYQMVYTRDQMGALVGKQRLTITTAAKIKNGDIVSPGSELVSKEVEITSGSNVFDFDLAAVGDQQAK
ncbi:MAG TPA: hypothetical protein VGJ04_11360 [Pirellulales bacterium]|jgi:hypothetical protein